MTAQPIPEDPAGYLARAKAVHKLGRFDLALPERYACPDQTCCPVTVGELLWSADVMSA